VSDYAPHEDPGLEAATGRLGRAVGEAVRAAGDGRATVRVLATLVVAQALAASLLLFRLASEEARRESAERAASRCLWVNGQALRLADECADAFAGCVERRRDPPPDERTRTWARGR
jgi:hypothetical protein